MNPGFRTFPRPRHKAFAAVPQVIDTTNGNRFLHGFGRTPGLVQVWLLCTTAHSGFTVGQEIPIESVYRNATSDSDGRPYWYVVKDDQAVTVFLAAANVKIQTSAFAEVNLTHASWRVKVVCEDVFPLGAP